MKAVWFLLSVAALIVFAGLLAQTTIWPSVKSLAIVPTAADASFVTQSDDETMLADTTADDEMNTDEEGVVKRDDEMSELPNSSALIRTVLFDYEEDEPAWYTVNDDVMGGVSTSMVTTDAETQRLVFSGNLSLENNGGFASIRSQWSDYDLTGYDGLVLRVRGDGRTYQFRIRTEETGSEIAYATLIETEVGIWKDIYVSFEEMIPVYRGVIVRRAPALDPGSIRSFGLMLADKQEGDFLLEVETLSAVVVSSHQV